MRRIVQVITIASALLSQAHAQAAGPEFEAASIRPSEAAGFHFGSDGGTSSGGPGTSDPGMYRCTRCTLATLVMRAWRLQSYQLPGRSQLGSGTFEVMAKVPAGTTQADFESMLQNLLKERFRVAGHFSEKSLKGYHLTVAKNGPKLQESTDGAKPAAAPQQHGGFGGGGFGGGDHGHTGVISFGGNARYRADHQTMAELAKILSDQLGLPVDDQTGLKGKYDISLNWTGTTASDDNHAAGPGHGDHGGAPGGAGPLGRAEAGDAPGLLAAVQAQLGLRLVRADQATASIFIIDHAEQTPTAN